MCIFQESYPNFWICFKLVHIIYHSLANLMQISILMMKNVVNKFRLRFGYICKKWLISLNSISQELLDIETRFIAWLMKNNAIWYSILKFHKPRKKWPFLVNFKKGLISQNPISWETLDIQARLKAQWMQNNIPQCVLG